MDSDAIGTHVGSELLFENSKVRVWDLALEPGEWSEWHRHEHDYVIVYVTDAQLALQLPDGQEERSWVADGYASHTSVGSGADPRLTHRLANAGDRRLRHVVIEILNTRTDADAPMRIESNDPAEMLDQARADQAR